METCLGVPLLGVSPAGDDAYLRPRLAAARPTAPTRPTPDETGPSIASEAVPETLEGPAAPDDDMLNIRNAAGRATAMAHLQEAGGPPKRGEARRSKDAWLLRRKALGADGFPGTNLEHSLLRLAADRAREVCVDEGARGVMRMHPACVFRVEAVRVAID